MKFQRKQFFDGFRDRLDPSISQEQVDGLEFLLSQFETHPRWKDIRHIAYALATIFHETAGSFQPVEEGYYLGGKARVQKFQKTLRYYPYFGRGYVQLTWKSNYEKAGEALGIDLVNEPELALNAKHAFNILTEGLFRGWYGGKLTTYINADKTDYVNARRCVNVLDKAGMIAGYAKSFEKILKTSAAAASEKEGPSLPAPLENDIANKGKTPLLDPATSADDPPPPNDSQPVEVTQKQEVTTAAGTESVQVTQKNEQDVNETVVQPGPVPYNDGKGLKDTLISDAKTVLPANFGLQMASEYVQQATGWPPWVIGLLGKAAIILVVITALWALYRIGSWLVHNWRENERVKLMATINTDITRKNIEFCEVFTKDQKKNSSAV